MSRVDVPQIYKVLLNIVNSAFSILSVLFTPTSPTDEFSLTGQSPIRVNLETLHADLSAAETILKRRLGAGTDDPGDYRTGSTSIADPNHELFVRNNISWKDRFTKGRKSDVGLRFSTPTDVAGEGHKSEKDEAMEILLARKSDLELLWKSPVVQELLSRRGIRLEETSGL